MKSLQCLLLFLVPCALPQHPPQAPSYGNNQQGNQQQYPQGYYPFEESPAKIPPKVRKPPYLQTQVPCPGVGSGNQEQTLDNLCGDLNKGYLPLNPMGQNVEGVSYPFDIFKKETLEFFSKTLPILKADDTLPKVAKYEENHISYNHKIFESKPSSKITFYRHRTRRSADFPSMISQKEIDDMLKENENNGQERSSSSEAQQLPRQARGWCNGSSGVICMLLNAFSGNSEQAKVSEASDRVGDSDLPTVSGLNSLDAPMTPCPSAVEYVTPVFAKNYQGVWRYVVQIPYEGYFTQTVEVVKCLSTKCEYLDGSCLASPRWVSLLVAEIYYPDTSFPSPGAAVPQQQPQNPQVGPNSNNRSPVQGAHPPGQQGYGGYFLRRQGLAQGGQQGARPTTPPEKCDGHDEMGCYQVRLYYDWFLIPGSCKCWKNDFFDQYAKK